jgi:hypothetical protein
MRRQLHPFRSPAQEAELYASRYDHTFWSEHRARVLRTAKLLRDMNPHSVADLSCGDAAIVGTAGFFDDAQLGDLTPGWQFCGPIEQTVTQIAPVDVFVCCETIEHVQDPDALLAAIRPMAARLLLSTPSGEQPEHNNLEHYWGWDAEDMRAMLADADWHGDVQEVRFGQTAYSYTYQIWRCA